tara:strand:- start:4554 stop:5624 length:1071 start_codon:yes stop_codon:yes gene_type:complete
MGNIDNFLLIVILLFIIFGLLFLIYIKPSFYKQKEGFIDCAKCPSCEDLEASKYNLCEQPWMYGVLADSNIRPSQRQGRLDNMEKCYRTECYEQCYDGPKAGVVKWDPGNTPNEKGVGSRKYNDGKYYESVCGQKVIETEEQNRVCCMAMTPECLACSAGIPVDEYKKKFPGHGSDEDAEDTNVPEDTNIPEDSEDAEDVEDAEDTNVPEDAGDAGDAEDVEDAEESDCLVYIEKIDEYSKLNNEYESKIQDTSEELNHIRDELTSKYNKKIYDLNSKHKSIIQDTRDELTSKYNKEINDLNSTLENKTKELNETKKQCSIKHSHLLSRISQLNNTIPRKSNSNSFKFGKFGKFER